MRQIVLDTETTGIEISAGNRLIEIGCVELIGRVRTGVTYHTFINPQRDMPTEAFNIHGISGEFLKDKPVFSKIAREFLDFIGNSQLIIHNAGFDVNFLNHELGLLGMPQVKMGRVIDTLTMARKKFPGSPASLDALCKRFNISLESRDKHGALIDAELLSMVYIELMGGAQSSMMLDKQEQEVRAAENENVLQMAKEARNFPATETEIKAHKAMLEKIKNPKWESVS